MTRFTFDATIERGEDELEVRVTYDVTPFIAETRLQPAEGGEVEIIAAEFVGVGPVDMPAPLDDGEYVTLQWLAESRAPDDLAEAAADYADYLYEQQRDCRMMDAFEKKEA